MSSHLPFFFLSETCIKTVSFKKSILHYDFIEIVTVCALVWANACEHRCPLSPDALNSLELGIPAIINHLICVLEPELRYPKSNPLS